MKIVFISGPPRCGKDTAAQLIATEAAEKMALDKFAIELKERCHSAYRLMLQNGMPIPWHYFEGTKDVPLAAFEGRSPRSAYIEFYRHWVEPVCGAGALGRWLVKRVKHFTALMLSRGQAIPGMVISDAGRREDCIPVIREWGADSCILIRLSREGCTFKGDSRRDFTLRDLGVRTETVVNPGDTIAGLSNAIRRAVPVLYMKLILP